MQHLGDITKISGADAPAVDVIIGGSPCQDLSLAGKRAGLAGERSGLFMEQIRIIKEMRKKDESNGRTGVNVRPRYMVWENVPGAFSSAKGEDFRAVLEETAKVADENAAVPRPKDGKWTKAGCILADGWSIAWRVLDAQFWGVPQRRARIALVADFAGQSASEILFVRESQAGHTQPGEEKGQGTATDTEDGTGTADRNIYSIENHANDSRVGIREDGTVQTLTQRMGTGGGNVPMVVQDKEPIIAFNALQDPVSLENKTPCITQGNNKAGQANVAIAYSFDSLASNSMKSSNPNSGCREVTVARTIDTTRPDPSKNQGGIAIVEAKVMAVHQNQNGECRLGEVANTLNTNGNASGRNAPIVMTDTPENHAYSIQGNMIGRADQNGPQGNGVNEDVSFTLNATDKHAVVYSLDRAAYNQGRNAQYGISIQDDGITQTLVAKGPGVVCAPPSYIVRRLTPMECERLQGFPSFKKMDFSKMTKDEYIAYAIYNGDIVVDADNGKVFTTRGPGGIMLDKPRELKGSDCNGYLVAKITCKNTKLTCRLHRVVWISQHGVIPDGYVVDHINNDKKDNRISNLQLLTSAQNSAKASKDGLYATGEDNVATKLSPKLHDEIAYLYDVSDMTMRELAQLYGISKSRIHQIIKEVGWTDIGEWVDTKGKKHKDADAPRYKALGNSIALPPWKWVLKRLCAMYERDATMASLFDGIGGFPCIWEQINGKGTCLWASEIEEFPIAVTKKRIGE
jgi:DNA (cytosine-5)-methyltransferase 1